jgi:hypothetical protein
VHLTTTAANKSKSGSCFYLSVLYVTGKSNSAAAGCSTRGRRVGRQGDRGWFNTMTESLSMGHAPPRRPLLPLAVALEEALVPAVAALLEEQVELLARTRSAD